MNKLHKLLRRYDRVMWKYWLHDKICRFFQRLADRQIAIMEDIGVALDKIARQIQEADGE